jgi:hypothetical protein
MEYKKNGLVCQCDINQAQNIEGEPAPHLLMRGDEGTGEKAGESYLTGDTGATGTRSATAGLCPMIPDVHL